MVLQKWAKFYDTENIDISSASGKLLVQKK